MALRVGFIPAAPTSPFIKRSTLFLDDISSNPSLPFSISRSLFLNLFFSLLYDLEFKTETVFG